MRHSSRAAVGSGRGRAKGWLSVTAVLLFLAAVFAACGDGDSTPEATETTAATAKKVTASQACTDSFRNGHNQEKGGERRRRRSFHRFKPARAWRNGQPLKGRLVSTFRARRPVSWTTPASPPVPRSRRSGSARRPRTRSSHRDDPYCRPVTSQGIDNVRERHRLRVG